MHVSPRTNLGFTLLEVLIALSIFSVIGLAAYRVLDVAILSQGQIETHDNKLRSLERAMHIIAMDVEQLINRPVRDNYADELGALLAPSEHYALEFTRQGWRNPLQLPRSQLQRVAYGLGSIDNKDGSTSTHLLRFYWKVLDRAQDSEPLAQVLLKNIDDLKIRFLDSEGEWQTEWPYSTSTGMLSNTMPSALMVELHSLEAGQIQRLFQLSEVSEWQHSGFTISTIDSDEDSEDDNETLEEYDESTDEYDQILDETDYDEYEYNPNDFHDLGGHE